jgi:hypothetical protein
MEFKYEESDGVRKYTVNGKEYASLQDVPEEFRSLFKDAPREFRDFFKDENNDGTPDGMELKNILRTAIRMGSVGSPPEVPPTDNKKFSSSALPSFEEPEKSSGKKIWKFLLIVLIGSAIYFYYNYYYLAHQQQGIVADSTAIAKPDSLLLSVSPDSPPAAEKASEKGVDDSSGPVVRSSNNSFYFTVQGTNIQVFDGSSEPIVDFTLQKPEGSSDDIAPEQLIRMFPVQDGTDLLTKQFTLSINGSPCQLNADADTTYQVTLGNKIFHAEKFIIGEGMHKESNNHAFLMDAPSGCVRLSTVWLTSTYRASADDPGLPGFDAGTEAQWEQNILESVNAGR